MSDSDIKIFTGSKNMQDTAGLSAAVETIRAHRANGNFEKARRLGRELAELSPDDDEVERRLELDELSAKTFLTQDVMFQIRVLLVFAAESLLQLKIPVELLATTAVNALYDKLREDMPGFFRNISDGTAFTFYYLAIKNDADISQNIGKTFSMLCAVEKNTESYTEIGRQVWEKAKEVIVDKISETKFVSIYPSQQGKRS